MTTPTPCTVLIVTTDNEVRTETWADGGTLDHLHEAIGHTVTVLQLGDVDIWLDDEALFTTDPEINEPISLWLSTQGPNRGFIYGPAVLAASNADGATVSLPAERRAELHRLFSRCPNPLCDAEPGWPCDPACSWAGPDPTH